MAARPSTPDRHLNVGAAVLAWLWPGLGHLSLGQRKRGLLIMFGVLFLVVTGLLIGGLDVVDRKRDRLWFLAQALCGPIALATDLASQAVVPRMPDDWSRDFDWLQRYAEEPRDAGIERQLAATSLGRVNEIGTLYIALAGLMNLVVILDALSRAPGEPHRRDRRADDA